MLNRIQRYLQMSGQCSSSELAEFLSISVSTVSRYLSQLISDGKVVRLGQGKNIRYIALRNIDGINQPVLIRQIDPQANVLQLGELWITHNGTILVTDNKTIEYDNLPWFFFDLKPQGFIGRLIGRRVGRKLKVPTKVDRWNSDDILRYLVLEENNTAGNFQLFHDFKSVRCRKQLTVPRNVILERYDAHVKKPIFTEFEDNGGSSAGGEQPKFNSKPSANYVSSIVKYSPLLNVGNPIAERVKDLLICEHHALKVLQEFNSFAANSKIFITNDRLYLEVERFDRTVVNDKEGQIGMVSLESVIGQFVGYAGNWAEASDSLLAEGIINHEDAQLLKLWLAFSRFIGNTDTHNGNVSLFLDGIEPSRLTPAYDILPMTYMPSNSELPTPEITIRNSQLIDDATWKQGRELGCKFWEIITTETRISDDFKHIAMQWLAYVQSHK